MYIFTLFILIYYSHWYLISFSQHIYMKCTKLFKIDLKQ